MIPLDGFDATDFSHGGTVRPVYRRGRGPAVVVMHEVPGITPEVTTFAKTVSEHGFTAIVPSLFGTPGKAFSIPYNTAELARACVGREFFLLATRRASPITDWLRALCRSVHAEIGGPGVGAVGMCITGNFALTLMLEPCVLAPVLSQPSLPLPIGRRRREALHLADDVLDVVKGRAERDDLTVLGLRFTGDWLCPRDRFRRLERELGRRFEAIEIDSSLGNPDRTPWYAHSVVTSPLLERSGHPTQAALARVLTFLGSRLHVSGSPRETKTR
jgi:dienelactone hydrolase